MKELIGRKVRGFKFDTGLSGVRFAPEMEEYVGRLGTITEQNLHEDNLHNRVRFEDGESWSYPTSEIRKHLTIEVDGVELVIGRDYEFRSEEDLEWDKATLVAIIDHEFPYVAVGLITPFCYQYVREAREELPETGLLIYEATGDIIYRSGEESGYGFLGAKDWCTGEDFSFKTKPSLWRKVTAQERVLWKDCAEKHLTDKLGFTPGCKFKSAASGREFTYLGVTLMGGSGDVVLNTDWGVLMFGGKWAELVTEKGDFDLVLEKIKETKEFGDKLGFNVAFLIENK